MANLTITRFFELLAESQIKQLAHDPNRLKVLKEIIETAKMELIDAGYEKSEIDKIIDTINTAHDRVNCGQLAVHDPVCDPN